MIHNRDNPYLKTFDKHHIKTPIARELILSGKYKPAISSLMLCCEKRIKELEVIKGTITSIYVNEVLMPVPQLEHHQQKETVVCV